MARAETRLLLLSFSQSTSCGCEHWSRSIAGVKLRGRSTAAGYPATSLGSDGEFRQGSRWTLLHSPRLQGTGVTLLGSPGPCGSQARPPAGLRSSAAGSPTRPRARPAQHPAPLAAAARPEGSKSARSPPSSGRPTAASPGRPAPEILTGDTARTAGSSSAARRPSRRGSHSPGRPAAPAPPPPPPPAAAIFPCKARGEEGAGCLRSTLRPGRTTRAPPAPPLRPLGGPGSPSFAAPAPAASGGRSLVPLRRRGPPAAPATLPGQTPPPPALPAAPPANPSPAHCHGNRGGGGVSPWQPRRIPWPASAA